MLFPYSTNICFTPANFAFGSILLKNYNTLRFK